MGRTPHDRCRSSPYGRTNGSPDTTKRGRHREFHGSATGHLPGVPCNDVFEHITNIDLLPTWNRAIEQVVESPPALTPGAEWVVVMHPSAMPRWKSRSRGVEEITPGTSFTYRSQTDDGNPSFVTWQWLLTPAIDGTDVTVRWDGYPQTVGRRLVGAPLRRRMLQHEAPASLESLRRVLEPATGASP